MELQVQVCITLLTSFLLESEIVITFCAGMIQSRRISSNNAMVGRK